MKLKAIEMQGFKSFPEKTKMTFEGGITAVIGPNGSGKSNISDAIRWVLGEMSVKSLRGSRMEDVIFNGTEKRPAANYASVSLYLDTAEEFKSISKDGEDDGQKANDVPDVMPKIRLSDAEEFVITRKYYRSGESEYYINKKQVRLKDVYELFYDTGIGREGYSVIGQGKIAEVLSVKGDERRSIFEEASGISKFRYKKLEAERKLKDTDANLERINDILTEVENRVEPLAKEAENAKKYLVLAKEKKELEITIWLEKADALRESLDNSEKLLAASRLELDLATDELATLEKEEEEFTNQGYALMRRKSELETTLSDLNLRISELVRQNSVFENDKAHYIEKIQSLKRESDLVSGRTSLIGEQIAANTKDLEDATALYEKLNAESISLSAERDKIMSPGISVLQTKEKELENVSQATEKLNQVLAEALSLKTLILASEKNSEGNSERLKQSSQRLEQLKAERDNLGSREKELNLEITQIKNQINELVSKQKALEINKATYDREISSLKVNAAAAEEQRAALNRLERLFEGYSDSVKTVMRQASEGKIRVGNRPIDLRGTVASLLSTEGEYVVAIETALGGAVQFIVAGSETDAKAAINHLKATGGGRITLLPLDTVKGRRCDVSKIKDLPGFIGIASDLVACDDMYKGIADDLLGRTVIAGDIEKASVMARKCNYSIKIVTIDGQIINAGGSYTGGSPQKKVGIFTRNSDIEKLDEEISKINEKLLDFQLKRRNAEKESENLSGEISSLNARLDELNSQYDSVKNLFSHAAAVYGEEEIKYKDLISYRTAGESERESLASKLSSLETLADKLRFIISQAQAEASKADEELKAISNKAEGIKEKISAISLELVAVNARVNSIKDKLDELNDRLADEKERLGEIAGEIAECENILKENEATSAENAIKIAEYNVKIKEINAEKAQIDHRLDEREKALPERRSRLKFAQIRREQAFESYTKLETTQKSSREEYDEILSRMWEEYELTYSAAEEFRLPLEQRDKMPSRLNTVKAKIRAMGAINLKAVEEYEELKVRRNFLKAQTDDLNRTRRKLDAEISRLEATMEKTFIETFDNINRTFGKVFSELFEGGFARLELTDPSKPLECGIDIVIRPPGKAIRSITLLSGGEQAFAAIALYLALQEINPSPFCIFDEIEAALDEVNTLKLMDYIKDHCGKTQFILITHRRGTMERADTLYGITMREKGVSEYLRLDLDTLGEKIKEFTNGDK